MKYRYLLLIILFTAICTGQTVKNSKQVKNKVDVPLSERTLNISPLTNNLIIEAEDAESVSGAPRVTDSSASGGYLVSLTKSGQGIRFSDLPAAHKLAIRYASIEVGAISVVVNDKPVIKVNVHSSGALTGSFLHSIIDIAIPAHATLTTD